MGDAPSSGPVLPSLSGREIIVETIDQGSHGLCVRAIDVATGVEASVAGPRSAQGAQAGRFYALRALQKALISQGVLRPVTDSDPTGRPDPPCPDPPPKTTAFLRRGRLA